MDQSPPHGYDASPTGIDWVGSSPTYKELYSHFFLDSRDLRYVSVAEADCLEPSEAEALRVLLREHLHLGYVHLIDGVGALRDHASADRLREMLANEADLSRRLTLARALWNICREPILHKLLDEMVASDWTALKEAHIDDVLVTKDEHSITLLLRLLEDRGTFVRYLALTHLNGIQFKKRFLGPSAQLPHDAAYYRSRRNDQAFIQQMAKNLAEC